jgi:hypothetical protein
MAQITLNSTGVASSGALVLQSNGTTTAVTVSTGQVATLVNDAVVNGLTVGRGAGAVATNTAVGASALAANTTGSESTAVGYQSLKTTSTSLANTAFGAYTLRDNTTGNANAAFGRTALVQNTTGASNTSIGTDSLYSNTTASNNTAVGYQAGYTNSTGTGHSILGYQAGYSQTTANRNTLVGIVTGYGLTTGSGNTFIGNPGLGNAAGCGFAMTTGNDNTIIGGYTGNQGVLDIRTASNYIVLSDGAGNVRLYLTNTGTCVVPAIYADTTANAANVQVDSGGVLRRSTSALKYKQDIRDIEAIDINLLRGVRYKSKSEQDDQTKDHFGIVADEVDAAGIKELVSYGADGEVEGFQYERLTVVLLKKLQTLDAEFKAYVATHP